MAFTQTEVRAIEQYTLQHHNFFYTLLHNNAFVDLYSTPQADFQPTVKTYTWFYYSIIPKTFVTTACKFNSSRKFSLFDLYPLYSSSAPAKPKFCNPYFSCLRPWRNTILQIMNAVFSGYFRNVFIVFIISFGLCLFLVQNTVTFEKLNTIELFLSKTLAN